MRSKRTLRVWGALATGAWMQLAGGTAAMPPEADAASPAALAAAPLSTDPAALEDALALAAEEAGPAPALLNVDGVSLAFALALPAQEAALAPVLLDGDATALERALALPAQEGSLASALLRADATALEHALALPARTPDGAGPGGRAVLDEGAAGALASQGGGEVAAEDPEDEFGAPTQAVLLDGLRGGTDTVWNDMALSGTVANNSAVHIVTGSNIVTDGAFTNASGLPTVIQNSGANVLIQNATIVNVQLK